MKLALHGATTMKADLWQDLDAASAAGFDGVEIPIEKLELAIAERGVAAIKTALDERGLEACAISSIEQVSFRSGDEELELRERCRQLADYARRISCPRVLLTPGRAPEGSSRTEITTETARILCDLSDIAGIQVNLGFEFIGGQDLSVSTLGHAVEVVDTVNRRNVGVVIDCFHFHTGGSLYTDLERLDLALLCLVQLSDAEPRPRAELRDSMRLLPGSGGLPVVARILSWLRRIGYQDVTSIELPRPEYWEREPTELATACRDGALQVLGDAGLM